MNISPKKRPVWLVTGGRGFLGSEVCKKLHSKDIQVISLDSKSPDPNVPWDEITLKLTDENVKELANFNFDGIIHLAALKSVHESILHPEMYHANNVEMSVALLNYAKEREVRSFIFISSAAVYKSSSEKISETYELDPLSPYGLSKAVFEGEIEAWDSPFPRNILRVRPFNIVGVNSSGDLSDSVITKTLYAIRDIETFTEFQNSKELGEVQASPVRDFIDVADVAEIISRLVFKCDSEYFDSRLVLNACTGTGHSVREIIIKSEKASGGILNRISKAADPREIFISIGSNSILKKLVGEINFRSVEESIQNEWRVILNEK